MSTVRLSIVDTSFRKNDINRFLQVPRTWTSGHDIALPIIPLWSGFLLNTLLIATLLFGMINGYSLARSTLRRRHHRCPTCNYNCRNLHSPTCPECGKPHGIPVPPSTQPTSTT